MKSGHIEKQTSLKLVCFTSLTTVPMFQANVKQNVSPDRGLATPSTREQLEMG